MLEMYEGKVTIDISKVSDLTRHYLVEFKEKLNEHINELREGSVKKAKQKSTDTDPISNAEHHRRMISGQ